MASQVGVKDGVVLLTYSSLISAADSGASRLQQLVDWCKPGFDGLIVFDGESHCTIPVYPTRPTHTTASRYLHAPDCGRKAAPKWQQVLTGVLLIPKLPMKLLDLPVQSATKPRT